MTARTSAARALSPDTRLVSLPRGVVVRISRRSLVVTTVTLAAALAVATWSLTLGQVPISVGDALTVFVGGGTLIERDAVLNGRLPRAVTGLGVGAAFALSGAVLQRIARNPLVSPDVIGINAGAAIGALTVLTVLGRGGVATVVGALAGALGAAGLILLIAYRQGLQGFRLVLVGIGVAAMLSSVISFLLTRSDIQRALSATVWLTGSLANRGVLHVSVVAGALVVAAPVLVVLSQRLRLLELDTDLARSLSGRRGTGTIPLLVVAVALAALAVAAAGPIAFVALVAPQIARRLMADGRIALAPSAAVGALVVVCADLGARTLFAPTEMPVGVLTAVLGAPVLIYLLARSQRIGAAG